LLLRLLSLVGIGKADCLQLSYQGLCRPDRLMESLTRSETRVQTRIGVVHLVLPRPNARADRVRPLAVRLLRVVATTASSTDYESEGCEPSPHDDSPSVHRVDVAPPWECHRRPGHVRTLTALATTSARIASEITDCTIIAIFAQGASGITSVGLKAVAL